MSRSKKNNNNSLFDADRLINDAMLMNNLKFGQMLHFDPTSQNWVVESSLANIVDELKYKAISKRFENMEFALDEEGRPDGLKNRQEMVLTIAGDIADSINELVFEEAKKALEREDWLNRQAMGLLKESMED